MIESALVYLSLMGLMLLTGSRYYHVPLKEGKHNIPFVYCFIPSLLFAIVFGIRYGVGTDHLQYISNYLFGSNREVEVGFQFVQNIFVKLGLHYSWFFGFLAFVQVSLFISAIKDRYLYPWLVIVLVLGCQWLGWCNGIRQAIAACFFIYSVQFIEEKKPIPYLVCCFLAYLSHKSAVILFPFYFISRIDLFKIKWIPWAIFALAFAIQGTDIATGFLKNSFDNAATLLNYDYDYSADSSLERIVNKDGESSGLGSLVINLTSILILSFMQLAKRRFNNKWFVVISNLFLIGLFGSVAFSNVVVLYRPFGYFTPFRGIIIAYLLFFFFKSEKKYTVWGWIMLFLVLLIFIATLYRGDFNTAEYHTVFESISQ